MSDSNKKEYTNGEITIIWEPGICAHSGICARGLPKVFRPKERPWIQMEEATSEELIKQVEQCPSGALSWKKASGEKELAIPEDSTKITIVPNGPIRVHGTIEITHSNGVMETRERMTSLCRCGMSANKPFCDGSHKRNDWLES